MENYQICRVAIAPLRKEPSDRSEIVSQLLFGDRVKVIEQTEKWWLVQNFDDDYQGWMDFKQLTRLGEAQYLDKRSYTYLAPAAVNNTLIATNGSAYYVPAGCTLPFYADGFCFLGEEKFELKFDAWMPSRQTIASELEATAKFFENAPYLWGGRTLFGIDCSGFVQTVFRLHGLQLKRDASQQAEQGELVDFLSGATVGDLAFFDNEAGQITHVGMMLGNDKIIHAAGKVRIDPIDDQGIFNPEQGRYTHKLRIVKRFF